jgi:hypothetical protein
MSEGQYQAIYEEMLEAVDYEPVVSEAMPIVARELAARDAVISEALEHAKDAAHPPVDSTDDELRRRYAKAINDIADILSSQPTAPDLRDAVIEQIRALHSVGVKDYGGETNGSAWCFRCDVPWPCAHERILSSLPSTGDRS